MGSRILSESVTGGYARLTQNVPSAKLLRYVPSEPALVAVQIGSIAITEAAATITHVVADITWGTGNGFQQATVDVGAGTAFTVVSDAPVDVAVRLRNAVASTVVVDVVGSAGLAFAPNARLPLLTDPFVAIDAAGTSLFVIPRYAVSCRIQANTANAPDNTDIDFSVRSDTFSTANVLLNAVGYGEFDIPGSARGMRLTNNNLVQVRYAPVWRLAL